jgi:hypothetical protein
VQTGGDVNAQCGKSQWTGLWYEGYPYQGTVYVEPFSTGVGDNVYFQVNLPGLKAGGFRPSLRGSALRCASGCVDGCPAGPRGGGGCL